MTASEIRISDWRSDVCSSDLGRGRDQMHVDRQPLAEHAARIVDAALAVDRIGDRDRMDELALDAVGGAVRAAVRPRGPVAAVCPVHVPVAGAAPGTRLLADAAQVGVVDLLAAAVHIDAQGLGGGLAGPEAYGDRRARFP